MKIITRKQQDEAICLIDEIRKAYLSFDEERITKATCNLIDLTYIICGMKGMEKLCELTSRDIEVIREDIAKEKQKIIEFNKGTKNEED